MVLMGNYEPKHLNGVLSYAQDIVKLQFEVDYEAFMAWVVHWVTFMKQMKQSSYMQLLSMTGY
jgi:hypothetical protein